MRLGQIRQAIGDALRLAAPYFSSNERGIAWGLLAAIVALNLFVVYLNVVYTYWYKVAYDALAGKDAATFWASMLTYRVVPGFPYLIPGFVAIAAATILASVYAFYLSQMLQIRWRRWLTERYVTAWLGERAYYRLGLGAASGSAPDNPDQRIADDLASFTSEMLTLGVSLLANVVTIVSFIGVLWTIAPPLRIHGVLVPGYLVYAALGYSIVGTVLTQVIGRPLIPLNYQQQQVNADFRFGLARIREHTEQIALLHGEGAETGRLFDRFGAIYRNWWRIMNRTKALNFFTIGFTQVAVIFPFVVAAPSYFSGVIALGVLMQVTTVFANVQSALSWFVASYPDIVTWRATVQRLADFSAAVERAQSTSAALDVRRGDALTVHDLSVDLPDGRPLLAQVDVELGYGEPVVLTGPSGSGKSTLFRVLAGIWPFARGSLVRPEGLLLFLPQRPYFPLGTLKGAIAYPQSSDALADAAVAEALADVGLGDLVPRLHDTENWSLRLSGGEQQRLALARALLAAPRWLFLDEALSALDPPSARALFALLRRRLPDVQLVSISHDPAVTALHPRVLRIVPERGSAAHVTAVTGGAAHLAGAGPP